MIDKTTQLKAGGRVRISGVWHDLILEETRKLIEVKIGHHRVTASDMHGVIEAYEPPKPKAEPFDWFAGMDYAQRMAPQLLADLTKQHGDPTHHTYANEPAADFGLLGSTDVLLWLDDVPARWIECEFRHLEEGNQWRLQPAAPKGVKV